MQNVMLAALEFDLATCPQAALAEYPDIVRAELDETYQDKMLVAGIALGYPDMTQAINQYRTQREDVNKFTSWFSWRATFFTLSLRSAIINIIFNSLGENHG
jgi:nitroreductase